MSGIWWQMAFFGPEGWRGGINTEADTVSDAVTWTHIAGINPGGELQIVGFRAEWMDPEYVDRLITDIDVWANQPIPLGIQQLPSPFPPGLVGSGPFLPPAVN